MPVCEIVSCTPTGMTFTIAVAIVSHEDEDPYTWILQQLQHLLGSKVSEVILTDRELGLIKALGVVFPHVHHSLCWVHILRKCEHHAFEKTKSEVIKDSFRADCTSLINSCLEESYESRRGYLFHKWPALMSYVQRVWLTPYKRKIVRFWTDRVFHLGNRTTNM